MKSYLLVACALCIASLPLTIGKNYYYNPGGANWWGANERCNAQGLQLATVNSEEEQNDLLALLKQENEHGYTWIAGSDLAINGKFNWAPTGEAFNFTYWTEGEPSAGPNDRCVWQNGYEGRWRAEHCASNIYFICEDK